MEAAQQWAAAPEGPSEAEDERVLKDLQAMGADDTAMAAARAQIAQQRAARAPVAFDVYPENWDAVRLFLGLQTQWRVGPMGGLVGLDYPGVEAAMRMARVKDRAQLFEQLQTMEFAALEAMHANQ